MKIDGEPGQVIISKYKHPASRLLRTNFGEKYKKN